MRPSKRRGENERSWDGDGVSPLETSGGNLEAWKEGVSILRVLLFSKPPPEDIAQGLLFRGEPLRSLL